MVWGKKTMRARGRPGEKLPWRKNGLNLHTPEGFKRRNKR